MANTIRLRRGTTTPSANNFVVGEPAWDQSAGKLYVKNGAGTMVLINGGATGGNQDYGLLDGAVDGSADYGGLV